MQLFPSPTGVLYISILNRDTMLLFGGVSVPYWGSLYFNTTNAEIMAFNLDVSVPYWGSLYFNPVLCSPYNYRAAKPDCGAKPNPAFYHLKI